MDIAGNIALLRKEIPQHIKIIAVSKTMPVSSIKEAYETGQRAFGENKVQELLNKQPLMPEDTEWHLIGHLQTNKVKFVVPFVNMIHSVDSLKLLSEINREAAKIGKTINCLLQIRIATEVTKFGLTWPEARNIFSSEDFATLRFIKIVGLMGMATFTDDENRLKEEFALLAGYFNEAQKLWFSKDPSFKEISMGMSGDYKIAIAAGSTMVRIGSLIFGERLYNR